MKHKTSSIETIVKIAGFHDAPDHPESADKPAIEIYVIGGAVRDALLGMPVHDRDFLVIGATPAEMMASGFTPHASDPSVFLHPISQDEHALAPAEKHIPGDNGLAYHTPSEIVLERMLKKSDLTINAIAQAEDGSIIDPFGGEKDLQDRLIRHVSPAFAEDPFRIFRVARLVARFPEFSVAEKTNVLMQQMVADGMLERISPELIWLELAGGLMEARPSRMFDVLRECGALARVLPEVEALWGVPQAEKYHPEIDTGRHAMMALDCVARRNHSLPIRFAALTHDLGKGGTPPEAWPRHDGHEARSERLIEKICQRLSIPDDCRTLALITARNHIDVSAALSLRATNVIGLFERCNAFRETHLFVDMLHASECDHHGHTGIAGKPFAQAAYLQSALNAAQSVSEEEIAAQYPGQRRRLLAALRKARVAAVRGHNLSRAR
jgi:tRNA nucleotidyltransferase (CCA-adding enzyme)